MTAIRRLVLVAVVLVGVTFLTVLWLMVGASSARGSLQEARQAVGAARQHLAAGEVDAAATSIEEARAAVEAAAGSVDGPVWAAAAGIPLFGRSPAAIRAVVDVAGAAVQVGDELVTRSDRLLGSDGWLETSSTGQRVNLDRLRDVARTLESLPVEDLVEARQRLAGIPPGWMPAEVRTARADALDMVGRAVEGLEDGRALTEALPSFLGSDEPRRYFLATQTSAELRGTGGFLGFFAVLEVDGGRFTLERPEVIGEIAPYHQGGDAPPVPTSEAFAQRYAHVEASDFIPNINVDPDLPTVAEVIIDYYANRRGERLDGVIALDPVGLSLILEVAGQVQVPEEVLDPGGRLPNPVSPNRLDEVIMVEAYDAFGEDISSRKLYLTELGVAAFQKLFTTAWDGVAMARALSEATAERHLQLYSIDQTEQSAFRGAGIAGELTAGWDHAREGDPVQDGRVGSSTENRSDAPRCSSADLLAVTANNAAGNKQDVHVAHRFSGDIRLALADGALVRERVIAARQATLRVEVENPVPTTGHSLGIVGSMPPASTTGYSGPRGLNRTWFTIWAPAATAMQALRGPEGETTLAGTGHIHGHAAFDYFLETPSKSTRSFEMELTGKTTLVRDGPDLLYRLTLWRQAKAIPDHLDLRVVGPDGWGIADVRLRGGGDGSGMGVGGDGTPVEAAVEGRSVHLTGAVTADLHLEVRYSRSVGARLRAWLGAPLVGSR